jgi:hypothetical protein
VRWWEKVGVRRKVDVREKEASPMAATRGKLFNEEATAPPSVRGAWAVVDPEAESETMFEGSRKSVESLRCEKKKSEGHYGSTQAGRDM